MVSVSSILDGFVDRSVWLNDVLIPVASVESTLSRYTNQLVTVNDDLTYKITITGSTVLLKYKNNYFAICSSHQLKGHELSRIALMSTDGSFCFTSGGVHQFDAKEEEYHDVAAFDFSGPCLAHPALQKRFFEFRNFPPNALASDTSFVIISGFPHKDQAYDLEASNHLGAVKRILVCSLDSPSNDHSALVLKTSAPMSFDPDGLSGGAAFSVQKIDNQLRAFFGGLIVRAGNQYITIVKSNYVQQFLETVILKNT